MGVLRQGPRSGRRGVAGRPAAGPLAAALLVAALAGCGAEAETAPATDASSGGSSVSASAAAGGSGSAGSTQEPTGTPPAATSGPAAGTGTAGVTGRGAPIPWETSGQALPATPPSAPPGAATLSILLDDGFGVRSTWTLTCDPVGGTHPWAQTACGVLGARGATALPVVPGDTVCTQQYGGPQKAKITGTWRGKKIASEVSLENGCQIDRWTALLGLLPPGGVAS